MERPKEDVILKQRKDKMNKYNKEYYKSTRGDLKKIEDQKKRCREYKHTHIYKKYFKEEKPFLILQRKKLYDKIRDERKHPFLRTNVGEFLLSFN